MITAEQRERRRSGLGGSDAPIVVLGADEFRTRLDVYADKVLPPAPEKSDSARDAGNALEAGIRTLAGRALGVRIDADAETHVHPKHPWMLVHLDGRSSDGGIFEAKALDFRKARNLGEPGTDECLRSHFVQVQHAMEVVDKPFAHVGYLVGPYDLRLFLVERDREIGRMIVGREGRFWREHVLARVPPPNDDTEAALRFNERAYTGSKKAALEATRGTPAYELLRELRDAVAARKRAHEIEDEIAARVQALMGEHRRIECDLGHVTWSGGGKSTAWKEVAAEAGASRELIQKHTKPSGRRFLPKFDDADESGEE